MVPPYAKTLTRALRKQPKVYLWDWSEVDQPGARFENLVAGHLHKACDAWTDTGKGIFSLYYVRDKEKREVDFLVTKDRKPWLMVECKLPDKTPAPELGYFARILRPDLAIQVIAAPGVRNSFDVDGRPGYVVSADRFLPLLP
jgi:predicted AAA+ superfamily ATPase